MLHDFVKANHEILVARTRLRVEKRPSPRVTVVELDVGIPIFLDQLVAALIDATPSPDVIDAIGRSATLHGAYLLDQGLNVSQVVHDYGDVCQAVTELAQEMGAPITTEEFHTMNRCLDDAIAQAVTEHTRRREKAIVDEGTLRSGEMAHELRNRLAAANMGFHLIMRGSVATNGSVSSMVARNLDRMSSIIQRSLVEVRLESGPEYREDVSVASLLEEAESDGSMEAVARNLIFNVDAVDPTVRVWVDRQVLAGAIANLLQNAFKFTRQRSHVALKTSVTTDRVLIEVEDECGGLAMENMEQMFRPFRQHGQDRSGLGLGLFLSRKGIEQCEGILTVKNVSGRGCVFSIDLPRLDESRRKAEKTSAPSER